MQKYGILACLCCWIISVSAFALEFPLPPSGDNIVGELQTVKSVPGDTLSSIGMEYNIGYYEMVEANPTLPKNGRIHPSTEVIIPSEFILPSIHHGLVVNLAELRVYYFPVHEPVVYTFPIGAGREGWNTPKASTKVTRKKEDPVWIVPDSIMQESIDQGKPIKKYWPPGPDNPLGKYAIYLAIPGIRIHGTNIPASVGRRISHGCIRLLPDDIKFLYEYVPIGTTVQITHDQNKVAWKGHELYLESEVPFSEYNDEESAQEAIKVAIKNRPARIDWALVQAVTEQQTGIPTPIGTD